MGKDFDILAIMVTFRDLFPEKGDVGKKYLIRILETLSERDCIFILSRLSRHHFKYCQMGYGRTNDHEIYRARCEELLSPEIIKKIQEHERVDEKKFDILFPELSIIYLIRQCLKHCKKGVHTADAGFPKETLEKVGECLLIANSLMVDAQLADVGTLTEAEDEQLSINLTKQLIADEDFFPTQKFYQTHYLFCRYLVLHKDLFDVETYFLRRFGVSMEAYFSLLFLLYCQFQITNSDTEDYEELPHLVKGVAFENLKPEFDVRILEKFLINNVKYKRIDEGFWSWADLMGRPLLELVNGVIIAPSLKCLFAGLTDSTYFDVLDSLPNATEADRKMRSNFSSAFGKAVEDYFFDIIYHIDKAAIREHQYGKDDKKTPDAILPCSNGVVFFECKKRQFHSLEFLQNGNKEMYFDRLNEFCCKPLKQVVDRIKDFRRGQFVIPGAEADAQIYPVIISPIAPPLFSGAWDRFALQDRVCPEGYKTDSKIALPEFIDFAELESIEAYLSQNPDKNFIDLIKLKRADIQYKNGNWIVFLQKNGMSLHNTRLIREYIETTKNFRTNLFLGRV